MAPKQGQLLIFRFSIDDFEVTKLQKLGYVKTHHKLDCKKHKSQTTLDM